MHKKERPDHWREIVFLLFFGWFTIWVYRTVLTPVFPEIQQTIGKQSDAAMGLISSCYFLGYVLMQIPGGILMDRIGRRRTLVPGFILFVTGILLVGLSKSITTLYIGSLLAGLATGTYYSGAFSLSSRSIPRDKKFFTTALINNGCAFGMIFGLVASSIWVKRLGMSWQSVVFLAAVLAAAMVPLLLRILEKGAPAVGAENAGGEPVKLKTLFRFSHIAAYLFYFSTCYGYYMIVTWLPSFLEQERGITGSAVGLAASVVAVASIPGAMLLGRLLDRFASYKTIALVLLQLAAAVMLILSARVLSATPLVVCLALYGITGKQSIDPLIVPHMAELNSQGASATGFAVFNFFGMSSSVLAPLVTGMISDATGSRVMGFYLASLLLAASAVLFFAAGRPVRQG